MSARALRVLLAILALTAATAGAARGQSAAASDAIDPIRCWWRTSAGAVAIGEAFDASLTCAVRDEETTRVTLDESRLGAAVVQLAPFEVLGGSHPGDLRTPTHRLIQYSYSLRIIDRDVIGHDAKFPDLQLSYKVQTRVGADANEGRDRVYVLPGRPVRVLSLVPVEADDIRDSTGENFATVEALRFRGRALRIAAFGLAALGLLILTPAIVRLVRGTTRREERSDRIDARHTLPEVAATLASIESSKAAGWTVDLTARAAAATRLAAACALGRPIAQRVVGSGSPAGSDRIVVQRGWPRRTRTVVSSAVTTRDLDAAIAALPLTTPGSNRQALEDLRKAVNTTTSALYGQAKLNDDSLDEALAAAVRATRHLRRAYAWPRSVLAAPRPHKPEEARA